MAVRWHPGKHPLSLVLVVSLCMVCWSCRDESDTVTAGSNINHGLLSGDKTSVGESTEYSDAVRSSVESEDNLGVGNAGVSDEDVSVEVEEEEEDVIPLFVPTNEWQVVEEGQSIPPGLHVRLSMQTGLREAKLLNEDEGPQQEGDSGESSSTHKPCNDELTSPESTQLMPGKDSGLSIVSTSVEQSLPNDATGAVTHDDSTQTDYEDSSSAGSDGRSKFAGDQRRSDYYGQSDRRGIINKKTKVFTKKEVYDMLENLTASDSNPQNVPGIAFSEPVEGESVNEHQDERDRQPKITFHNGAELPVTLHEDVESMLEHITVLAKENATITELLHALEELEDYVHEIHNARDLNVIGGLVLIVRLLNHSNSDVREHAAHVVGAAVQSNPEVQTETLQYQGLDLLCDLLSITEPEIVQRRALFAISALLRGNPFTQAVFMEKCKAFKELASDFKLRSPQVQIKGVTLITDIFNEQRPALLLDHIQQYGWCEHVTTLIHAEQPARIEKGLLAMMALGSVCDFTSQAPRLQDLAKQFEVSLKHEDDEFEQTLLHYCHSLLQTIRINNRDL